jgi:tRNA 2-thiouridine synthesizing protein A
MSPSAGGPETFTDPRLCQLLRRLADLAPGTVVHLIAADPAAPIDLGAWCHLTGHTCLGPLGGHGRATYALRVTAAPQATRAASPWRPAP